MARPPKVELDFFPFFVDKFLDATMTWPAQRVGAYVRLLSYQWKRGSVPGDDLEELSRVIGEPLEVASALWDRLKVKFPKGTEGYQNRKLEDVRADVLRRFRGNKQRTKAATDAKRSTSRTDDDHRDGARDGHVTMPPTNDKLKTVNNEKEKTFPPLTPPSSGGESPSSVTGGLTEKDPTRKERADAKALYDEFGCPHEPECETEETCLGRLVGEKRARERAGLRQGLQEGATVA